MSVALSDAHALHEPGPPRGPDGAPWSYRMKDLCEATGLGRQAIHFYIKEGLLPAGLKSSRNMAWYGEVHLERLRLVRRLQEERFLPLRAIKAFFDGEQDHFTPAQRAWLRDVKHRAAATLARGADRVERVAAEPLLAQAGVTSTELATLDRLGLVPVVFDEAGQPIVAEADAWVIEAMGELRAAGFVSADGFEADDLAMYEEAISSLFAREQVVLAERLTRLPAARAVRMVEAVLPIVNRLLTRYHEAKLRRFFSALE